MLMLVRVHKPGLKVWMARYREGQEEGGMDGMNDGMIDIDSMDIDKHLWLVASSECLLPRRSRKSRVYFVCLLCMFPVRSNDVEDLDA